MGKAETKTLLKLALYGALAAIVINHFVEPSLKSATGLK